MQPLKSEIATAYPTLIDESKSKWALDDEFLDVNMSEGELRSHRLGLFNEKIKELL